MGSGAHRSDRDPARDAAAVHRAQPPVHMHMGPLEAAGSCLEGQDTVQFSFRK